MPEIPFVAPNFGDAIGGGLASSFDKIMNAMARRDAMGIEYAKMQRQKKMDDLKFAGETGYDPRQLGADSDMYDKFMLETTSDRDTERKLKQAHTSLYEAQAAWMNNNQGAGGIPGAEDVPPGFRTFVEPDSGQRFATWPGKSGPNYQAVQGQIAGGEERQRMALAKDGLRAIDQVKSMLKIPNARAKFFKAGTWQGLSKLAGMGDPEAQKLKSAIYRAVDARARPMSGAAIPPEEFDRYIERISGGGLSEPDALEFNLENERLFLTDLMESIGGGRANVSAAGDFAPGPKIQPGAPRVPARPGQSRTELPLPSTQPGQRRPLSSFVRP